MSDELLDRLSDHVEEIARHVRQGIIGRMSKHAATCTCVLCFEIDSARETLRAARRPTGRPTASKGES